MTTKLSTLALFLVTTWVASCGGSGGSNQHSEGGHTNSTLPLDQAASSIVATFNLNMATGYTGQDILYYNLLGQGDINGDGYDDLVVGLFRHTTVPSYSGREHDPSGSIKPIVLFYDPASDNYVINAQLQSVIRSNEHPRQIAIADFDGDGRNDLFIADHGYDDAPYGHQNTLLLNKTSGFVDGTSSLPAYADFSHGLVMGDLDGNGKPDLLVMNNRVDDQTKCGRYPGFTDCTSPPTKYSESYVLFNQGAQGLVKGTLDIPNDVLNFTATTSNMDKRLYVGHSADFNRDGRADLVVSDHRQLFIVESVGVGQYHPAQVFTPPLRAQTACNDFMPYTAIESLDMDGDGEPEIIASFGCKLTGVEFQVFKRSAVGIWSDVTANLVADQSANTRLPDGWCYKLLISDLNNDAVQDVICQSVRGQGTPSHNVFWTGGTQLKYADIHLQDGAWSNFHTTVLNKNGRYVIGLKHDQGQPEMTIRRWKIR